MSRFKICPLHTHINATINKHAFLSILTSCIEVYKKETFGILLGKKHKKRYKILDALNYQSAQRGYIDVVVPLRKVERIDYVLKHITDMNVLGFFHSHPDFPDGLSEIDVRQIQREIIPLQILVLVKKANKRKSWKFNEDLSISGTTGTKYFIKIRAYENNRERRTICPIKIVCPFLYRLNRLEKLHKKKHPHTG